MKERELTGNQMFELVKEECERILGKVETGGDTLIDGSLNPVEKRKKGKQSSMFVQSLSKEANGKDLSLLAKELMFWMMVNCDVPGVHPEHNYCNLNWNQSVPEIVVVLRKQLVKEFKKNHGYVPDGSYDNIKGFYVNGGSERFTIYMLDQDYSEILHQADLLHELSHYIQDRNGVITDCPPHYEVPTYLMQLHFYRKKTGGDATSKMIDAYKRNSCNTLYK